MKFQFTVGITLTTCALLLVVAESNAFALPCDLTAPPACVTARDKSGYAAGTYMGSGLVSQIWRSPAVDEQIDNWDILHQQVTVTIPNIVTAVYSASMDQYTQCRMQGLLDGSVCQMNTLNPIPGCQLNGADWGGISSAIYCGLSMALGGLADATPWFTRYPVGMCGAAFENYCDDTFRYGATTGVDPLLPEVEAFLVDEGIDPTSLLQPIECAAYTKDTYEQVFNDSVYTDCAYTIPPP